MKKLILLLVTSFIVGPVIALADPPAGVGHGLGHGNAGFGIGHRDEAITDTLGTTSNMPPGLAKKGKLPHGLAKQNKTPPGWYKGNKEGWKNRSLINDIINK